MRRYLVALTLAIIFGWTGAATALADSPPPKALVLPRPRRTRQPAVKLKEAMATWSDEWIDQAVRAYISATWATDWDSPEDSAYDKD
jgi:hypothetical protein